MPVDLHQRLSEFSYGYGVTREVERQLRSVGLRPTPFLPSLLHEAKLGFDVAFDRPGTALLLQFKLGEALQRFRRGNQCTSAPALGKPFWRFNVDSAELGGQFDLLRKAEQSGAEVYYIAPRFTTWDKYMLMFQAEDLLAQSLLVSPSEIDAKLESQGEPDGRHHIVYDQGNVFVCSEPIRLEETKGLDMAVAVRGKVEQRKQRTEDALKDVYDGLGSRRDIRGRPRDQGHDARTITPDLFPELEILRARFAREADARFAAVGLETWAIGAQLFAVTLDG